MTLRNRRLEDRRDLPGSQRHRWRAASNQLVLITDDRGDPAQTAELVRAAVAGGVDAVQLREERLNDLELRDLIGQLRPITDKAGCVLLVNDRVGPGALANGVHLGGRSIPPSAARSMLGNDAIIGYSAHDAAEVRWAEDQGADYVSLSPVFPTSSKPGAAALGLAGAA